MLIEDFKVNVSFSCTRNRKTLGLEDDNLTQVLKLNRPMKIETRLLESKTQFTK